MAASGPASRAALTNMPACTTLEVHLAGRVVRVQLRHDAELGETFASVDGGEALAARLDGLGGPRYVLRVGPSQHEVLLTTTRTGDVRLWMHGLPLRARVLDEARARAERRPSSGRSRLGNAELKAPMPGLVVQILCQPGDAVDVGRPLVILRAMKMENELSARDTGTIAEVCVAPGEIVEQDQVLVRLV